MHTPQLKLKAFKKLILLYGLKGAFILCKPAEPIILKYQQIYIQAKVHFQLFKLIFLGLGFFSEHCWYF